jgi:hypothetical protein
MAFGHRWRPPVTRTVREGASVRSLASHRTHCVIGTCDCAKAIVDVDSCNGASLRCFLAYASGYWADGLRPLGHLLVTRTVREGASVHGLASHRTHCVKGTYDCAKAIVYGDSCNRRLLRCFLAYASGYWADGLRPLGHLLVTRTVREGASVHGLASHCTHCAIGTCDCAKGIVDVDSCNGASLLCFLAYASGYWADGLRPLGHLLVTRSVREGASVHGLASHCTHCVINAYDCANAIVDGDSCNGASLRCFLAYASGYWSDGLRPSRL